MTSRTTEHHADTTGPYWSWMYPHKLLQHSPSQSVPGIMRCVRRELTEALTLFVLPLISSGTMGYLFMFPCTYLTSHPASSNVPSKLLKLLEVQHLSHLHPWALLMQWSQPPKPPALLPQLLRGSLSTAGRGHSNKFFLLFRWFELSTGVRKMVEGSTTFEKRRYKHYFYLSIYFCWEAYMLGLSLPCNWRSCKYSDLYVCSLSFYSYLFQKDSSCSDCTIWAHFQLYCRFGINTPCICVLVRTVIFVVWKPNFHIVGNYVIVFSEHVRDN